MSWRPTFKALNELFALISKLIPRTIPSICQSNQEKKIANTD